MTLLASPPAWKDLMRKLVLSYPNQPSVRNMKFVENVGFQVYHLISIVYYDIFSIPTILRKLCTFSNCNYWQVKSADFSDPSTWVWVFGPELHFNSEGKLLSETERTHYWYSCLSFFFVYLLNFSRYPTLSNKLGEDVQERFTALNFIPDPNHDLSVLLEAARKPQTWPCLLTNAVYLGATCMHFIRKVTKQYPVVLYSIIFSHVCMKTFVWQQYESQNISFQ